MRLASSTTDGLGTNAAAAAPIPRAEPDRSRRGARHQELLETIAAISHAAVEGVWHDVLLDRLAAIVPGATIALFGHDRQRPSGNFMMHRGLPRDLATRRAAALTAGSGGEPSAWAQPVGVVFSIEGDRPARRMPDGGARGAVSFGLVLRRHGARQLVLELRAPARAAEQGMMVEPAEELLGTLAPHLVTAARVSWLRADPSASAMPAAALLRALSFPLVLLDADRRVHSLNDAARHATLRMETLHIGADGVLRAIDMESERRLSDAVNLAAAGVRGRCDLLELRNAAGTRRIFASLRRLDTNGGAVSPGETQAEALVALAFQDAGEPLDLGAAALWEAFGLSPAEATLALRLLEGHSLGEIAAAHRVAKQTLRNQLAAVMRKTGTSRQAELVALLTRLALVALR